LRLVVIILTCFIFLLLVTVVGNKTGPLLILSNYSHWSCLLVFFSFFTLNGTSVKMSQEPIVFCCYQALKSTIFLKSRCNMGSW
jgi:hypothetical protein